MGSGAFERDCDDRYKIAATPPRGVALTSSQTVELGAWTWMKTVQLDVRVRFERVWSERSYVLCSALCVTDSVRTVSGVVIPPSSDLGDGRLCDL